MPNDVESQANTEHSDEKVGLLSSTLMRIIYVACYILLCASS